MKSEQHASSKHGKVRATLYLGGDLLEAPLSREHLSVIGGITAEGGLYQQALDHAVKGPDVVGFLRHLVRHLERVLVSWDGLPAHRGKEVKRYLSEEAQVRVWLERLPGYAPDLNPKEGFWKHLKLVELKNLCCENLEELKAAYQLPRGGCGTGGRPFAPVSRWQA